MAEGELQQAVRELFDLFMIDAEVMAQFGWLWPQQKRQVAWSMVHSVTQKDVYRLIEKIHNALAEGNVSTKGNQ